MAKKKKPAPAKAVGSKKPRKVRTGSAPSAKKTVVGGTPDHRKGTRKKPKQKTVETPLKASRTSKGKSAKKGHKPKPPARKPVKKGKSKGRPMKRTGLRAVIFDINKYCAAAKERFAKLYPEAGKDALAKEVWDSLRVSGLRPTRHNIKQVLRASELIRKKKKKGEKEEPEQPPQYPRLPVRYEDPVTKEKKAYGYWELNITNDEIPVYFDERIYIQAKEIMAPGIWLKGGVKYNYYETFQPFVRWANEQQQNAESWQSETLMFRFSDLVQHPVQKDRWETSIILVFEGEDVKVIPGFEGLEHPPTGAIVSAVPIEHPAPPKELPPAPAQPPTEPSTRMKELELEVQKLELEIRKMELELQLKGEKPGTARKRPSGKKKKKAVAKKPRSRAGLAPATSAKKKGAAKPAKKKPVRKTTPAKKAAPQNKDNGKAISSLARLLEKGLISKADFNSAIKKLK